jgi:hypothetical protein
MNRETVVFSGRNGYADGQKDTPIAMEIPQDSPDAVAGAIADISDLFCPIKLDKCFAQTQLYEIISSC